SSHAACGLTAPVALDFSSPKQGRSSFCQPWVVIGRDEHLPLPLGDASVSRRHAYLQVLEGRILAIDLDSRTGLAVDGIATPSSWLDPGQQLTVGTFRLERASGPALDVDRPTLRGDPLAAP